MNEKKFRRGFLIILFILAIAYNIYFVFFMNYYDMPDWPENRLWTWAVPVYIIWPLIATILLTIPTIGIIYDKKWAYLIGLIFQFIPFYPTYYWMGQKYDWVNFYYVITIAISIWILFIYPPLLKETHSASHRSPPDGHQTGDKDASPEEPVD